MSAPLFSGGTKGFVGWPDFHMLPECRRGDHEACPEWIRDEAGNKKVGCTCVCHSPEEE
jgi:hypothetical protein